MNNESLLNKIQIASRKVGKTWPLYSFVTSNPLSGFENIPFQNAIKDAESLLDANVLPNSVTFRQAWENGEINRKELVTLLNENGINQTPDECLLQMDSSKKIKVQNSNAKLDRMMVKWLMAFLDEGLAEWEMPYKEDGFYRAWRILAVYDDEIDVEFLSNIPQDSIDALAQVLETYTEQEQLIIMEYHLAALPGWIGYIKFREETNSNWQQEYNITLQDYLAVRLWLANHIKAEIIPSNDQHIYNPNQKIQYLWLKAWERSWQNNLVKDLKKQTQETKILDSAKVPDAQMVFCIDTRSELIRRNVESTGNYETFGYAGFFGIAMDYVNMDDGLSRKSCPPIVPSNYNVSETPQQDKSKHFAKHQKRNARVRFTDYFLRRMKNMLPSAFGYVEGSGVFYGISLLSRTLIPAKLYNPKQKNRQSHEKVCTPEIEYSLIAGVDTIITLKEKTAIVKSAFDLMGWRQFSPLVLFVGHGSHSANNPFGSSLDCGACAASPGRHNARMLAKMANLPEVRNSLKYDHDLHIPEQTVFLGAEHNTTTDEIVVFDSEIPDFHKEQLLRLKNDLGKAQQAASQERLGGPTKCIASAHRKANDWAETRPEWGLARNAGFIVGPRSLTKNINLNGHCFLHSYNWELDKNGEALEGIMQGPMVVTQWINNHYYFSTVDNEKFGAGSKITHNITGKFGVVQGNGGDLKLGLPLQSVNESDEKNYHQPLRLSVLIQAPKERIQEILLRNENLKNLLDNEWIYLLVMDPLTKNKIERYQKGMQWVPSRTFHEEFVESI
jgi:uncharacterized protein YbcC (UPF0753/DUF2309 family)